MNERCKKSLKFYNNMFFEPTAITPYLTIYGPIGGAIAILDYILRDEQKATAVDRLFRMAQIGTRPFTFEFYGLTTLCSVGFTLFIISVNGSLRTFDGEKESIFVALQSSGPLLVAVILKIAIWDYLLALKSYFLLNVLASGKSRLQLVGKINNWPFLIASLMLICFDLYATTVFTSVFMNWSEVFQTSHVAAIDPSKIKLPPGISKSDTVNSVADLFHTMNLSIKDSITKSFYVLNGSLLMYTTSMISSVASGALRFFDVEGIKKHIFKVIAAYCALLVLVVSVCFYIANH